MSWRDRGRPEPIPSLASVVVPCLNRASYLEATLDSILAQDHGRLECIVVDGGSTDGTLDILRRYGDRIRWVSEPDGGHADAINKGWRMARGDVLAWLNADDLYPSGGVRRALAYLDAHPEVDLVYGDCALVDPEGRPLPEMIRPRDWDLRWAVEQCQWTIPQPAAFLRRRILEKVGWLDPAFVQKKDHELWLRVGLHGTIRRIPEVLAIQRDCVGISQRGDQMAAACLQLTEKFLALPGLPADLRTPSFARRARSNANLVAAVYAWPRANGGHRRLALRHVAAALRSDPSNLPRIAYRFLGTPVNASFPALRRIRARLPGGARGGVRPATGGPTP